MFRKIFNNIGVQLVSLASLLIFSVIFIIIYIGIKVDSLSEINSFHEKLNNYSTISITLDKNLSLFKTYEHPNTFFETYKDKSTEKIFNAIFSLYSLNKELAEYKDSERYKVASFFKQNKVLISEYEEKYALLIKNTVEIGNSDNGYIQKLNLLEKRLSESIKNNEFLRNEFNKIKKEKTNYLNSFNNESGEQFISDFNDFYRKAKVNVADEISKRLIVDICTEYLNNFRQIFNLQKISGINLNKGLYFDLKKISDELILNSSASFKNSKEIIKEDYKRFKTKVILIILTAAILILLIMFLLYRIFSIEFLKIRDLSDRLIFEKNKFSFFNLNIFVNKISDILQKHEKNVEIKIKAINDFASGNIKNTYSFNEKDTLGQAIVNLQSKISDEISKSEIVAKKRKTEDKHKEGIAKFGRILRRHVGDIDSLSYELISELVGFLDAEVGGIYVAEGSEEHKILSLRASYAYNEKKLIKKEIEFGEGLVGTCAVDKSTFFIDKVDDDYIKIVSGFGHTKPTSVIICPILVEEDVYGVIELAATRMFNKDDIKFIEVLAEDIAYTLSYLLSLKDAVVIE